MIGTLVRMIPGKAFAFLAHKDTDYFFHRDDFEDDWNDLVYDFQAKERITLKFDIIESDKGPRATRVSRL